MYTLNILYYHHLVSLLLEEKTQKEIMKFINTKGDDNQFHKIYSCKYSYSYPYIKFEQIFLTKTYDNYIILLYTNSCDDNNIFLILEIICDKLRIVGFGEEPINDEMSMTNILQSKQTYQYEYYYGSSKDDEYIKNLLVSTLYVDSNVEINSRDFFYNRTPNLDCFNSIKTWHYNQYQFWIEFWNIILSCDIINIINIIINYLVRNPSIRKTVEEYSETKLPKNIIFQNLKDQNIKKINKR